MVVGPRFHAFLPLGSKGNVDHDCVFLFEAYQQPYESVMAMPSSRRHRFVKIREEIVRTKGKPSGGRTPSYSTGLDPRPQTPMIDRSARV